MDVRFPRYSHRSVWSQAVRTLRALKGWQAIPATILAVYLLVGILVPIDWESVRASGSHTDGVPPLGRDAESGELLLLGSDYRGIDLFEYVLWGAYQVALYAVPATLIGMAVGWAAAWGVSTLSRRLRYASYAVLAAVFIPTVVSTIDVNELDISLFPVRVWVDDYPLEISILGDTHILLSYNDSRISVSSYSANWVLEHPLLGPTVDAIGSIASVIMLAVPAAVCSFLIMTIFKYSRAPASQSSVQSHDENDLSPDIENPSTPPRGNQIVLWTGLNFFAGLGLVIFIMSAVPTWFSDIFPYYRCPSSAPYGPIDPSGCYAAAFYESLDWHVWMPSIVMLTVLASAILMVKWLSSEVRRESQRSSPVLSDLSAATRPKLFTQFLLAIIVAIVVAIAGYALAIVLVVALEVIDIPGALAIVNVSDILTGSLFGVALATLALYDSRSHGVGFAVLVSTIFSSYSLGITYVIQNDIGLASNIILPFAVGLFGLIAILAPPSISGSRRIMFAVPIPGIIVWFLLMLQIGQMFYEVDFGFNEALVIILIVATLIFPGMFVCVEAVRRLSTRPNAGRRFRILVAAVIAIVAVVLAGWTVYVVMLPLSDKIGPHHAHTAFGMVTVLGAASLAFLLVVYSNVRRGYNVFVWVGILPILLFFLLISSPQFDYVLGNYFIAPRTFGALRNFLLAFMIAYLWLSAVRLQSIRSALGVAVAAAAVTYAAVSLVLNDDNSARFLVDRFMEAIGYAPTGEEPAMSFLMGESGNYWIRTYAFGIIVSAVAAAGLSVYTLLRRAAGTIPPPRE